MASFAGELRGELVGVGCLRESAWSVRTIETWKGLHAADVRIAFGSYGNTREPGALRSSAMALARATGDPQAALAAVTLHPAQLAGGREERQTAL